MFILSAIMKNVICIISLGSNTDAVSNLQKARDLLVRAYPGISFSPVKETVPVNMQNNQNPFLNQLAKFSTDQEAEDVHAALKVMERFCGRRPDDKELETIHIDIDLLAHGDTVVKPEDFARYTEEIKMLQASSQASPQQP